LEFLIMKNRLSFILVLSIIGTVGLGCSSINPFSGSESGPASNKSITDKGVDVTVGRSKIGVPECDEVSDLIEAEMNNPDDNFVTKAIKATVLNRIKDGIRDSVEKNKGDTVELAKTCKEFRVQFEKFKAEEKSKQP
jgi:hypothetical protein